MPVYVDESVRSGRYLLCAVVVEAVDQKKTRQMLRAVGARPIRTARDECLRTMMSAMDAIATDLLVIESCGQDHQDNLVIRQCLSHPVANPRMAYRHASPVSEPLLWLPDIVAWAYGRSGEWRNRAMIIVDKIIDAAP